MTDEQHFEKGDHAGHVWRSKMLDQFALVEAWAVQIADEIGERASSASLGQRICKIRASIDRFKKPERMKTLFDQAEEAIAWRNDIVHSTLQTYVNRDGDAIWRFFNVNGCEDLTKPTRAVLTSDDCKIRVRMLQRLVKELNDQHLKPPAPAAPAGTSATATGRKPAPPQP